MFTHSKTDIESCNFVFASACLQDMAVCNFFWPVYVYRQTCSRADMGVGECVCTLADIQTSALLCILAKFNGESGIIQQFLVQFPHMQKHTSGCSHNLEFSAAD